MAGTAEDRSGQQPIVLSKLLLVEGNDELWFSRSLLRCLGLSAEVQILKYDGKQKLRPLLSTLSRAPGYSELESLGVTRDADESFGSAFESVRSSLENAELDVPESSVMPTQGTPRVSVYIFPDCANPGMLETLCLSAVQEDAAMPCVEQFLQCLEECASMPSKSPGKARAHVFLASRERSNLRVGEAAEAGHWQLDSPVYDPLKSFLLAL